MPTQNRDHPEDVQNDEGSVRAALAMFAAAGRAVPEPWASMLARGERIRSGLTIANSAVRPTQSDSGGSSGA